MEYNKEKVKKQLANIKRARLILNSINHNLRRNMLVLLEDGSKTVTEIYCKLRIEQSVASQHLILLKRHGFIKSKKEGKYVYYSLNTTTFNRIGKLLADFSA